MNTSTTLAVRPAAGLPRLRAMRRFVAPALLVLAWQVAASTGLISSNAIPAPITIARTFGELLFSGELIKHLAVSLARVASGLVIGVAIGAFFALVAGLSRQGEDAVDATLQMLRTLPHLALVPLFVIWFGIGETPKVALVALGAFFPIYINLFSGIRAVDKKIMEAAQTLGLSRFERIRYIVLPGALPAFLVGLRYAIGVAWLSLVVGEQINASAGIGYLAQMGREFLRTDIIFVSLIVYALMGLGADQLVRLIEKKALAWRPTFVKE
jgi:sulfonate transport system permease protein